MRIRLDVRLAASTGRLRVEGELLAAIRKDDHADVFVGHVAALDVYSQGRTEAEALHALENGLRLYVATAYRRGILARLLERLPTAPGPDAKLTSRRQDLRIREERPAGDALDLPSATELVAR